MPDPVTTAVAVAAFLGVTPKEVANGVVEAIRAGYRSRSAARADEKVREEDQQQTYELAISLLGSTLFEIRSNIERVRWMAGDVIGYGVMDFTVSGALMGDLCRIAPSPAFLEQCRSLMALLKRIDFVLRTAAAASMEEAQMDVFLQQDQSAQAKLYRRAKAFAEDAMQKRIVERYNQILQIAQEMAVLVYKERAATTTNLLPGPIDPTAPLDHELM